MTRRIQIFDTTLRDGEQAPGFGMTAEAKLEVARQLSRLGVDVIEAGFPIASPGDFEAVREIARTVTGPTIAGLARANEEDIRRAYEAVREAAKPRIHTFIATSPIHMEYKLRKSPDEVVRIARESVALARSLGPEVEFSAEDATRSEWDFLARIFTEAAQAGATVLNVPDTVGYTTPKEFYDLIRYLIEHVDAPEGVIFSVHCHNDLGLAVANTLAAIEAGAMQVECTINGIGERAGNGALEEIVMALRTRKDRWGVDTGINTRELYRTSRLLQSMTGIAVQPNKAIVGANAFAHESGIHQHGVLAEKSTYEIMTPESIGLTQNRMVLGKLSGRHAFEERLKEMGYHHLSQEDITKAFEKFKVLADKKKTVLDRDIEALVGEKVSEVDEVYRLDSYQINSGNKVIATATVSMFKNGEPITEAATGDGPINAAFKAIERSVGFEVQLQDYSLKGVTEGTDALGEATVRILKDDKIYVGRGVSTDVIEASVKAYINAINRVMNDHGKGTADGRESV